MVLSGFITGITIDVNGDREPEIFCRAPLIAPRMVEELILPLATLRSTIFSNPSAPRSRPMRRSVASPRSRPCLERPRSRARR
jgi:hypothetical protein